MAARPLPPALEAKREEMAGRAGRISYYVAGDGRPLLLVHSINAAGSAYEIKPIFDHFKNTRRVYAPDLPGFGFSDRSRRHYDVALYVDAMRDMCALMHDRHPGEAVDALALSLSSEFLARASADAGCQCRTLALVTPTGFRRGSAALRDAEGTTREVPYLHGVLTVPLWRGALYKALVSPRSIRYFLKRTYGSDAIDEDLAAYDDLTTHQPGAEHAPYAFLSGRLFSRDIPEVYKRLEMPVWLAHGTRGDFKDFSEADWARERANWRVEAFDTGALPHFEQPAEFLARYEAFLAEMA